MFFKKPSLVLGGEPLRRRMPSFLFRWRRSADRRAVSWLTRIGESRARVKDVSSSGMYVEFDQDVPVGSTVEFVVDVDQDGTLLHMVCTGKVARVVRKDGRTGIGVKLTKPMRIRSGSGADEGGGLWRRL